MKTPEQLSFTINAKRAKPSELPFLHTEIATGENDQIGKFRIGSSMADGTLYMFTEIDHPNKKGRKIFYTITIRDIVSPMLETITESEKEG